MGRRNDPEKPKPKIYRPGFALVAQARRLQATQKREAERAAKKAADVAAKHAAAIAQAAGRKVSPTGPLIDFECRKCHGQVRLSRAFLAKLVYAKDREKSVEECLREDEERHQRLGCPFCAHQGPEQYSLQLVELPI